MTERFEEGLGRYTYVTLPQVKDYLSISSNTQDGRISNIISYATSALEHYIGQEVLANDYIEIFDGGVTSVFTSRLPLSNVYSVTEFNGVEHVMLNDPSTIGVPNDTNKTALSVSYYSGAHNTTKIKRFGKSSLKLDTSAYLKAGTVPSSYELEDSDFTIEMFVKVDEPTIQDNVLFSVNTSSSNYMSFELSNQYGLAFESNVSGTYTQVRGDNTSIETQQFQKRRWAHVAVSRVLDSERLYLFYNGNVIANASYTESNLTFTSNVEIGKTLKGFIDEIRVSNIPRYTASFTPPTYRFRPDENCITLIHFDEADESTEAKDVHGETGEYIFTRDTGRISRKKSLSRSDMSLSGPSMFYSYPSGVRVEYRAGYESTNIPLDLQLATLDYIKLLYKQDQERKSFSLEGERSESFNLSSNFPPHIARILDMYRTIK